VFVNILLSILAGTSVYMLLTQLVVNILLSILAGTAFYMLLTQLVF